jgi:predicted alpha/beta hydrolase
LDRRIPEKAMLVSEVAQWEHRRNAEATIKWLFTVRTGGYRGDSSSSEGGRRCRLVYVDAHRHQVALAYESGEVVELTP